MSPRPADRTRAELLLRAALDGTPVYVDGEERHVHASFYTEGGGTSRVRFGERSARCTFEPPFTPITPAEAALAVADGTPVRSRNGGTVPAQSLVRDTYGDLWLNARPITDWSKA